MADAKPASQRPVSWSEFDALCARLARTIRLEPIDLIVGIARGGLPAAVRLSHELSCRPFGAVLLTKTNSEDAFAVNALGKFVVSDLLLPAGSAATILIVDDIVAFGDAFTAIDEMLRQRYGPEVRLLHATLFADTTQVRSGPFAGILSTLYYGEDIDNKTTWIVFPWEGATT